MNPNRKVKSFHLTYKGHYMLSLPYKTEMLGYCYEEASEKHTHVVMKVREPISKLQVIKDLTPYLEIKCELEVDVHYKIETALGYHLGCGDKPRCNPGIVMLEPEGFDADD